MLARYTLIIGNEEYALGDDTLKNWRDIQCVCTRSGYDGVTRSITSKFEFVGKAYKVIFDEWKRVGMDADIRVKVAVINDNWEYEDAMETRLDMSTLSFDKTTLSLNGLDQTLAAKIKANAKTKFEYSVSALKELSPLNYTHLELNSSVAFVPNGDNIGSDSYETEPMDMVALGVVSCSINANTQSYVTLPFFFVENGDNYNLEPYDTDKAEVLNPLSVSPICKVLKGADNAVIKIDGRVALETEYSSGTDDPAYTFRLLAVPAFRVSKIANGVETILADLPLSPGASVYLSRTIQTDLSENDTITAYVVLPFMRCEQDPNVMRWERWSLGFYKDSKVDEDEGKTILTTHPIISLSVVNTAGATDSVDIDLIKPISLLRALAYSMAGEGVTCEIVPSQEPRLDKAMIMAAESIRNIKGAKIHTSYDDFSEWMSSVFGYVAQVTENGIRFLSRDSLFSSTDPVRLEQTGGDAKWSIDSGLLYSKVRAGYEKQDYSQTNGRDEFHASIEYTTGAIVTDKSMEFLSPYRADAYGIEFLVLDRKDKTTDNDNDDDVFFVCAQQAGDKYELYREGYEITGVVSPATMFNAMYDPVSMVKANLRYIAVFAPMLKFASFDGNGKVTINGVSIRGNVATGEALFSPLTCSVSALSDKPIRVIDSLFSFTCGSLKCVGFLKEAKWDIATDTPSDYKFIVKNIER